MRLVLVEWVDSCTTSGWMSAEDLDQLDEPLPVRSVGWLRRKTKKIVELVASRADEDGQFEGHMVIPRAAVTRIVGLKEPAKKSRRSR